MIEYFNPLAWMRWTGQFIALWFQSIPWSAFRSGIPAILLTVSLLLLSYFASSDGGSWRRNLLQDQLAKAIEIEDFKTADLLLRRQIDEGDHSVRTLYLLAENRSHMGDKEEATEMMRRLVIEQRSDAAAYWLIKEIYAGMAWPKLDEQQRSEFGRLVALVSQAQPADMRIKQLHASFLIASSRFAEAIPLLQQLTSVEPMHGLQAATLARRIGEPSLAERLATTTLAEVNKTFVEEPANPRLVIAVVQSQIFLDRHEEALQTLLDSVGRMKEKEHRQLLNHAIGDTVVSWIGKIKNESTGAPVEQLQTLRMLQLATQHAPNNPRVLTLVADQVLGALESSDADVVAVRDALIQGTSPGISHFIQGTAKLMRDDTESAQRHLTLAAEHLPNSAAVLNNLAVTLSQREGGDLQQALKLSEQAIAAVDQPVPAFYETRGQILFRLERYLDAIPDLERALASKQLALAAHETLAECYDNVEEPELAEDHRTAAERLREKEE